jgi:hypothetical protein
LEDFVDDIAERACMIGLWHGTRLPLWLPGSLNQKGRQHGFFPNTAPLWSMLRMVFPVAEVGVDAAGPFQRS